MKAADKNKNNNEGRRFKKQGTNKQASKQTNKQTNKQSNKQTN